MNKPDPPPIYANSANNWSTRTQASWCDLVKRLFMECTH